ncbi:glycosyltransferase [Clostridium tyrobutyricum]|uniref:glycosyltransferase n=1 Tax=Clostridium tyrobutyricum TaxID=1519 RepID=UPI001C37F141|nr:glycosyltransferase [Clostridium tyrobutyricum]MBV4428309.1 glycosyltransferase [Clostridium tyrobutyricum]MBV4443299.1 glycosyltransferase [Clostridium tyrobutyricum]
MNKKNILFIAYGDKSWIAGLYYVRNIMYSLFQNEETQNYFNVYLLVNNGYEQFFERMNGKYNFFTIKYENKLNDKKLIELCKKYSINAIFPVNRYIYKGLNDICIYWIPDFQHKYLEKIFSKKEINIRNRLFKYMVCNHKRLVLSSISSYNDYKLYYPDFLKNVYTIPFVSYIEEEIKEINDEFVKSIIEKYNLKGKYFYIPNQFWMHKNHKIVFEAMNTLVNYKNINVNLVCTGYTEDYRNKDFFDSLKNYIKQNNLVKNIRILGFVSRNEQLAIMKNSLCLIQPSLFEGWGTGVEDGKALDKNIILSDIPVHYEQKDENSLIFNRYSSEDLINKMMYILNKSREEDIHLSVRKTKERAKKYSYELVKLFNENLKINEDNIYDEIICKLKKIFNNSSNRNIGIYGTGDHTKNMLNAYVDLIGNIDFKLYFFDSNSSKWGQEFYNSKVYAPEYIKNFDLDRIIISSYEYQDEIYNTIKYLNKVEVEIVKIYKENEYNLFSNW